MTPRHYHKKKKKNLNNNNKENTKFFSSKFNDKRFVECFDYNNKLNLNSVIDKKLNFYNFKSPVARNKKFLLKEEIKKRKSKSYTEIRNLDLDHLDEKKSFEKTNFKVDE